MKKILSVFGAIVLAAAFLVSPGKASANPFYFSPTAQTAAATTSVKYLTPGTGTTTLTYDSFGSSPQNYYEPVQMAALIQFTGSSTSSVLNLGLEYSQDGIDWYRNTIIDQTQISTTTSTINLNTVNSYTLNFASTSPNGSASIATTTTRIIRIPILTRFVRMVSTLTGAAGAVWEQFIATKQLQ